MSDTEHLENIRQMVDYISDIIPRYRELSEEVGLADKMICDIEHRIENTKFDVQRGYRNAKELQEVRQYRRLLKNEMEIIQPLYDWYQDNKGIEVKLSKINTLASKIHKRHENWTYTDRISDKKKFMEAI